MNSKNFLSSHRAVIAGFIAGMSAMIAASGCSHRPIIVQAPPATVIQNPAPAPAATPAPSAPVVIMREPPPPPREETMPPQPSSDTVWIPGYWVWRDNQQQWVAGHWDTPPHVGATWVAPRWERQGDNYVFIQGYWQ